MNNMSLPHCLTIKYRLNGIEGGICCSSFKISQITVQRTELYLWKPRCSVAAEMCATPLPTSPWASDEGGDLLSKESQDLAPVKPYTWTHIPSISAEDSRHCWLCSKRLQNAWAHVESSKWAELSLSLWTPDLVGIEIARTYSLN